MSTASSSAAYPWHTIHLDRDVLIACVEHCRAAGVGYGLGAKAPSLAAEPGHDFRRIDCSGFLRWAIYQATGKSVVTPDGSVNIHDWVERAGFKQSDVESAGLKDGRVRIAFLSPAAGGGVGHVALVLDGLTVESHGGVGPDRRKWTGTGWQARTTVFRPGCWHRRGNIVRQSELEEKFEQALALHGPDLPVPQQQHVFAAELGRRWRADFAWPDAHLLVEIDGIYGNSRHRSVTGFHGDCDKLNAAVLLGWRVLRFTSKHIREEAYACVLAVRDCLNAEK